MQKTDWRGVALGLVPWLILIGAVVLSIVLAPAEDTDTADWQVPICENYKSTRHDSGYPCAIEHSDGAVEVKTR